MLPTIAAPPKPSLENVQPRSPLARSGDLPRQRWAAAPVFFGASNSELRANATNGGLVRNFRRVGNPPVVKTMQNGIGSSGRERRDVAASLPEPDARRDP